MNILEIGTYFKKKLEAGEAEDYEIIIALLAMVKDGKIKLSDIQPILFTVLSNDRWAVIRALKRANPLIDDDTLDLVLQGVHGGESIDKEDEKNS